MHDLHVIIIPSEPYAPNNSPLSGIFQKDQAEALKKRGFKVGVISPELVSPRSIINGSIKLKKGISFSIEHGIPVYRYNHLKLFLSLELLNLFIQLRSGIRLFRKYVEIHGMPDIIHAHNVLNAGIIANYIKRKYGCPYVVTEHSSRFSQNSIPGSFHSRIRIAYENSELLIVVSPSLGNILEARYGEVARNWRWVPNVLDSRFEEKAISVQKRRRDVVRILSVISLSNIKAPFNLINSFALKFKGQNNVQLRIVGDGPLRRDLEILVNQLQISGQVVFLGYMDRAGVLDEMQACDFFVLSSLSETFGVVLIEALSCGKPVVATACGGPECIVNNINGILTPVKDVEALGNTMVNIMNNLELYDSDQIRKDCIQRFGEASIVNKLSDIYYGIVSSRRS